MSRFLSVCLCAVVALVALFGAPLLAPAPALAASGTLEMETPLHETPEHGAPLIALLPEGTVVSIDGPPVDGFYPVSTGGLSGWMRGETLNLEKDIVEASPVAEPTDEWAPVEETATDEWAPIEQTAADDGAQVEPTDTIDPAADPTWSEAPPTETASADSEWTEPAADVTYDEPSTNEVDPADLAADPASEPAPADAAPGEAVPVEAVPVEAVPVEAAPVEAAPDAAAPVEAAPLDLTTKTVDGAMPVAAPATETPTDAIAEPVAAPDPNVTPVPAQAPSPLGPASVTVDAPIRTGPGPGFDLVFTVPMGSTLEQTGNVIDGYVTVQYKEVTGWAALDHLGAPSSFVPETPPGETVAPTEALPTGTAPAEAAPVAAEPVAAEPVAVKTPRPGSGVAFTTVDMSLRAGPSASETPVTVVPAGSRVVLTGVMEGGFQRVTYGDQIGWIADEYLQSPADPEPGIGNKGNEESYSRKQIVRIINGAADRYGQSRSDMLRVAECESNLNPYAVNPSGSYGLFQFIRTTWKSTPFGNKNIFDPEANANAAAWMWSEGRKSEWVCQ